MIGTAACKSLPLATPNTLTFGSYKYSCSGSAILVADRREPTGEFLSTSGVLTGQLALFRYKVSA